MLESEGYLCEFHWYECQGIGKVETKIKVVPKK